jgi:formamidopyrimidine-DNA glycosylase
VPEAPALEVTKDFLNQRASGSKILDVSILCPGVLRPVVADFEADAPGRVLKDVGRRGKFLLVDLSGDRVLLINPMLAGALQYCEPSARVYKKTFVVLKLSNGFELRYLDDKQMGRLYYTTEERLGEVPGFDDMGPDVLAETSFSDFRDRLKPFHGEIKGVLTRGRVVSGIGNAYADEILHDAKIYPFRKRKALSEDELRRLHESARAVVEDAIGVVRGRMGDDTHIKIRDFLKVHNKGGSPCHRCGANITQITANRRITSYCRTCQPGMLISS